MYTICRNDIIYINSHIYSNNIIKKNGGNDIMGSELIFSDTIHQFLQVLTLSLNYCDMVCGQNAFLDIF